MYQLLILTLTVLVLTSFIGCKGPITGKEYTSEDITKISKFLAVSEDRVIEYKNGNITIEELGVSADRLRQAIEFVEDK